MLKLPLSSVLYNVVCDDYKKGAKSCPTDDTYVTYCVEFRCLTAQFLIGQRSFKTVS